ncbi:MAG: diacylglycerol kinase family lipid kinase [Candidatus Cloacimonetes bacterium]|nr:diacylglycerol kinase family lipid kinase [Candidatus Cloacimonadota bacterium]MCF7814459.1 diacylglycerol kinase family lipid kinase [Candidatus Cloacimonadota bacterium]MCF7869034.1 diacylglycerol kinase family lipid kinase [Candidatus Cloacimonadota bacterium]MCF7884429.1 diacylglycerol kinase family lipid kinase [Candidatus Cloacimonadota bacterium]
MKFEIILNPVAGKDYAPKHIPVINKFLEENNCKYEIHLTHQPGHAINLAQDFARKENTAVIAAGGDGTCNEVINGLMLAKEELDHLPLFGVLPIGRGNDFAYGAHIPDKLAESLNVLISGHSQKMDVGLIAGGDFPQGRYFGNGIGVGFDTLVGLEAAKMKHIHGAAGYAIGAIKVLIKYPPAPEVELKFDDTILQINPALVSIMNGNRMGGTFFMSPEANNNDGILNLCMTKQGNRRELLKAMLHYTKGTQQSLENTTTLQSPSFSLEAKSGHLAVHADGETICQAGKKIDVKCIPSAINIICKKR